jgi:hypothetical protein
MIPANGSDGDFLASIAIFLWRMFPQTIKQPGRDPLRHRATD